MKFGSKLLTMLFLIASPAYAAITAPDRAELGVPRNYISNGGAERGTYGWATYSNSAANTPSTGSGGAPSTTWTRTTSTPLSGNASFLWTKAGSASRQGEGAAYNFTIDRADLAKPLSINFTYSVASGTFTASNGTTAPLNDGTTTTNAGNSDIEAFVYDVTNSVLIPVSPQVLTANQSGSYTYKATFQTAPNSTSYRLILHTATTTTNNFTLKFDNFFVGPQSVSYGTPVTDWVSWTPTGSWSTNTTYSGWKKRIGDVEYYRVKVALSGAPTAANLTINLPSTDVIDTTKISTTQFGNNLGAGAITSNGAGAWNAFVLYNNTTSVGIMYGSTAAGLTQFVTATAPVTFANLYEVDVWFSAPLVGISSTVQMSNDTDTRVVAMQANGTTTGTIASSVGSSTTAVYGSVAQDTPSGYSSGTYTINVSGFYRITAQAQLNGTFAAGNYLTAAIYKNGSLIKFNQSQAGGSTASQVPIPKVDHTVFCVAGDTITTRYASNATSPSFSGDATTNVFTVERLSGPSAIAASEKISAIYSTPATTSQTSGTTYFVDWGTKVKDSHSAVQGAGSGLVSSSGTGWRFIAPSPNVYHICEYVSYSAGLSAGRGLMSTYVNGSLSHNMAYVPTISGAANSILSGCTDEVLNAGDRLELGVNQTTGGAATFSSSANMTVSISSQ